MINDMLESVKEIFVVYGRIITLVPLLLITILFIGKRSISELPVFDFIIIITLGVVVGAAIAIPDISLLRTTVAISAIGFIQRVISSLIIKNRRISKWITFEPTVVIQNGHFLVGNLKRIRYSLDNILQMLREKDIFNVNDVELAVVEANGNLSVYKNSNKSFVTIEDLEIKKKHEGMSYPVIVEGKIESSVLNQLNLNEKWLKNQLQKKGIDKLDSIFFASINDKHELHFSFVNDVTKPAHPIVH
ncbi:DUF421 domain-containing protein [Bacillus methanolicus]|nr:DUF421 domain-containing protein [Bacillus methanolicus]